MNLFCCFNCPSEPNLAPMAETEDGDSCCVRCGSTRGEVITPERFREGLEAGVFYSVDAKGKRVGYKRNS